MLLLRDVFDFDYAEKIAALLGKSEAACRKLLERARQDVAKEKRLFSVSPEEHQRFLTAFTRAAQDGQVDTLVAMLAEDAVMVTDWRGPKCPREGRFQHAFQAPSRR